MERVDVEYDSISPPEVVRIHEQTRSCAARYNGIRQQVPATTILAGAALTKAHCPHQREEPLNEHVLICAGLRKNYGDLRAVDGVGFHIAAGETYGLLGPNGVGKTTAISMIVGILQADEGTVTVNGAEVSTTTPEAKSAIGFVPQDLAIYPDLSAKENLRFFGKLQGLSGDRLGVRVAHVLDIVGLSDRAEDRADTFSGGMKRRLNIAIGLLHEPKLLILDEPTVGVDPQSRNSILESVEQLSAEGLAVLYTTHYMEEAERLCDRVGIIDAGQLKAEGTRRELVAMVGGRDRIRFTVGGDARPGAAAAREVPGVDEVTDNAGVIEVMALDARSRLAPVLAAITGSGAAVTGVEVTEPDLEAVFLHVTGKALRD